MQCLSAKINHTIYCIFGCDPIFDAIPTLRDFSKKEISKINNYSFFVFRVQKPKDSSTKRVKVMQNAERKQRVFIRELLYIQKEKHNFSR
jgi:uncharacterized protein (DUF1015 family)